MCRLKKIFLAIMSFTFLSLTAQAKPKIVLIDGSSTVFPVTEAVAEEFQKAQRGKIRVTVGISGTGGGFKKFCRGETDVQNASRPISAEEILACKQNNIKYFELPIAYDAITVAVHPSNTWVDYMSVDELKKIWAPSAERKITRWNQIRPNWPDEPIKLLELEQIQVLLIILPKQLLVNLKPRAEILLPVKMTIR